MCVNVFGQNTQQLSGGEQIVVFFLLLMVIFLITFGLINLLKPTKEYRKLMKKNSDEINRLIDSLK